ncbi:MAG: hypothetical protein N2381_06210 [Armatimonadetes bacterium]|nr:hypothetical protein [Armatimonadota bacterium]
MQGRNDANILMVGFGWLVMGVAMLLLLTMTMGQHLEDEARLIRSERMLRQFSQFHILPISPSPFLSSLQGKEWKQDLVWFRPSITGARVAFSPDGQLLATTAGFGLIQIYRVSDLSLIRTLTGHTGWVYSVFLFT